MKSKFWGVTVIWGVCLIGQGDLEVGEQLRRLDPRRDDHVLGTTFYTVFVTGPSIFFNKKIIGL